MLSYLRVQGLALLQDVQLELAPGMNVLTGETGAGKSILVDALTLLRGARARSELLRAGADNCSVEAQFDLDPARSAQLAPLLAEHGLPAAPDSLVVKRTTPRGGRGRSFVQAELTTVQVLGAVGEHLIDICSQHEHHGLTRVGRHIELLDGYARLDDQVAAYGRTYAEYRDTLRALERLRTEASEGAARADYLRFQIDELERIAPEPGEIDRLRQRIELLRDAQGWQQFANDAHQVLYESEEAIIGVLAGLLDRARRGVSQSSRLEAMVEHLTAAQTACEEADHLATRLGAEVELDPGELEQNEERLHQLITLQRKHQSLDEADALLASMRDELATVEHADEHLAALAARAARLEDDCRRQAAQLHTARIQAARELSSALVAELAALHLPRARLEARVEPLDPETLGSRGLDRVEFVFSANPGEPLAPLTRVASGGELSRVLLALKGVVADTGTVATYVFDEVDAGVGGAVAEAIGQRLQQAARGSQVLCITHLPQIAACADAHFRVEKQTTRGRTTTRVSRLDAEERIEELARMLGGKQVTTSARDHARALLSQGHPDVPAKRRKRGR